MQMCNSYIIIYIFSTAFSEPFSDPFQTPLALLFEDSRKVSPKDFAK